MLQRIDLDQGCFACALGGPDQRTLFLMAAQMPDFSDASVAPPRTGQVLTMPAPAPGIG